MSVGIKLTAGITDAALENTDSSEGKSTQMVTAPNNFGDVVASHPFGALSAPTQNFAVIDDFDPEAKLILGTVANEAVLTSWNIKTGAAVAPTLDAGFDSVPADKATTGRTFKTPAAELKPCCCAQTLFGAFTLAGELCNLTSASYAGSVNLTRSPDAEHKSWCVSGGKIVCTIEVNQAGETAPTLTPGENWIVDVPFQKVESDQDYEKWSATLRYEITGIEPAEG